MAAINLAMAVDFRWAGFPLLAGVIDLGMVGVSFDPFGADFSDDFSDDFFIDNEIE